MQLRQVTLTRAWEPGGDDAAGERIEFACALDGSAMPDAQAWLEDPAPWPATRFRNGAAPQSGDVAHDEDGWQLRFYSGAPDAPDVPVHRVEFPGAGLRPGEVLTIWGPDGGASAWRVVGVL